MQLEQQGLGTRQRGGDRDRNNGAATGTGTTGRRQGQEQRGGDGDRSDEVGDWMSMTGSPRDIRELNVIDQIFDAFVNCLSIGRMVVISRDLLVKQIVHWTVCGFAEVDKLLGARHQ